MYQPNYQRIARKVVRDNLRVAPGEQVLIEVRNDAVPYAELIAFEVFKVGGVATLLLHSDDLRFQEMMVTPVEQLSLPRTPQIAAIEAADYLVTIGLFDAEPRRFRDLPAERVQAHQLRHGAPRRRAIYEKKKIKEIKGVKGVQGIKVLGTDYPTRYMAQAFGIVWSNFFEMFWRAMDIDYGQLAQRAAALAEQLEQGEQLHIKTRRGTDLRLRRGQQRVFRDDGFLRGVGHLPAGEVYFAPIEDSVEGRVVFDRVFHQGKPISLLELHFESGIGTPIGAVEGFETFMAQWDIATEDKNRIGQIGIGLNSEVRTPTGFPLTDEKILGTVHLSLGTALSPPHRTLACGVLGRERGAGGGKNQSVLYWAMLLLQPTVTVDDTLILDRGRFVFL